MIRKAATALAAACALALAAGAQDKKQKDWTEWSKRDAEKILNDSPWGQTQTETDTSGMLSQGNVPGSRGQSRNLGDSAGQAANAKYFVRFFTAKPIRQALVRTLLLGGKIDAIQSERMKQFTELQSNQYIIVTVTFTSPDQSFSDQAARAFSTAATDTLKSSAFLIRKDGKRAPLEEYAPPGRDGFGARFIFPRNVDGQPFITPDGGEVRFVAELGANREYKIDRRFKIADMVYDGRLEY